MIHSLRFVEKEVPVSVGGETTTRTLKILQCRSADLVLCDDGKNIENRIIGEWEDVKLCLDDLDPNLT